MITFVLVAMGRAPRVRSHGTAKSPLLADVA
jgi:hypothetical protein